MQYSASFLITDAVENVLLAVIVIPNQVSVITIVGLQKVAIVYVIEKVLIGPVLTIFMLKPKVFAVVGEGLVKRNIRPVLTGNHVTEPLVKKFVADEILGVPVEQVATVPVDVISMKRSGRIFHRAAHIVPSNNLCVFIPVKGNA